MFARHFWARSLFIGIDFSLGIYVFKMSKFFFRLIRVRFCVSYFMERWVCLLNGTSFVSIWTRDVLQFICFAIEFSWFSGLFSAALSFRLNRLFISWLDAITLLFCYISLMLSVGILRIFYNYMSYVPFIGLLFSVLQLWAFAFLLWG